MSTVLCVGCRNVKVFTADRRCDACREREAQAVKDARQREADDTEARSTRMVARGRVLAAQIRAGIGASDCRARLERELRRLP